MHSCEICKLFKNNYFEELLWMSTSKLYLKRDSNISVFLWFFELFKNTYFVKDLETPVLGFLFNKVASLMAWRPLAVLERDCSTSISLWILWNFSENFFAEHLLAAISHMMLLFFPFSDQWALQPKINLFSGAMVN